MPERDDWYDPWTGGSCSSTTNDLSITLRDVQINNCEWTSGTTLGSSSNDWQVVSTGHRWWLQADAWDRTDQQRRGGYMTPPAGRQSGPVHCGTPGCRTCEGFPEASEEANERARRIEEQRRQRQEEEARRRAARREAEEKAQALLVEHLDELQRDEYEQTECFTVIGSDGGEYRISTNSREGNVWRMEEGARVEELCGHLPGDIPLHDNALAQKLLLETDEDEFRRIANISTFRNPAVNF